MKRNCFDISSVHTNYTGCRKAGRTDGLYLKVNLTNLPYVQNTIFTILKYAQDNHFLVSTHNFIRDPHITVLYGIKQDSSFKRIRKICSLYDKITFSYTGLGYFDSDPLFDVLYFKIQSSDLESLHNHLSESIPNETIYSNYIPHQTICLIRKGSFKEFKKVILPIRQFSTTSSSYFCYDSTEDRKIFFKIR